MKKYKEYIFIILYGLFLIFLFVGFNNIYGSNTDWINQHTVFPEYFRNLFYETKNILPTFAFNLGAGQNIFNFSYYGFLSPVILISYLLPFVSMKSYIMIASIILYLLCGILMYKFLKNNFSNKIAFFLSLCFITLTPLTFHFHRHIMFVWYLPFLILALMGVDKYLKEHKSWLLIISIFLIIMTNYYYSVGSLIVIVIYGIYKLLEGYEKFELKRFIKDSCKAAVPILIGILLSGIVLLPSIYVVLNSKRSILSTTKALELIKPNLNEVFYRSYTMGLSALFVIAPLGLIFNKNHKKSDIFLSAVLIILSFIPIFMYSLNGFLYIRGKALIPFTVLYIVILAKFIISLKDRNVSLLKTAIISIIFLIIGLLTKYQNTFALLIDLGAVIITLIIYQKFKKEYIIFIPLLITLVFSSYLSNKNESFISKEDYKNISNNDVEKLINNINDDSFYRTNVYYRTSLNANTVYNSNYYSPNIYSSNYNNYYWDFYNFTSGNNIISRNAFLTSGAQNILFNNLMGIKYIVGKGDLGPNYEFIKKEGKYSLYRNINAYPIIYSTNEIGSYQEYEKLEFPYNMEYMLNNPITDNNVNNAYAAEIKEVDLGLEKDYEFSLEKAKTYHHKLKKPIKNAILIITFTMNYNESCSIGDSEIKINGIVNKLTCKEWLYHNQNHNFQYAITSNEDINDLTIKVSKGKYKISNISTYTMPYNFKKFIEVDNLKINKKDSIITAKTNNDDDSYVITSIPFDEGFTAYVDNKKVDIELVNTAFLGFKVPKGMHEIKIKYSSPWLNYGCIASTIGLISTLFIVIYEKRSKCDIL